MLLKKVFIDTVTEARKAGSLEEHGFCSNFWFCYDRKSGAHYLADCSAGLYIKITSEAYNYLLQLVERTSTTAVIYLGEGCTMKIVSTMLPGHTPEAKVSIIHGDCGILIERTVSLLKSKK